MKMSKYINKRIFVCLSVVVLLLIMVSFVASSVDGQQKCEKFNITFCQNRTGMVTGGTLINYTWEIKKMPTSCLADEPYFLEIRDDNNEVRVSYPFKTPRGSSSNFTGKGSWIVPVDKKTGTHTSHLKFSNGAGSYIEFEVVATLLVIQKVIDNKDKSLEGWEFKVTVDNKKPQTYETDEDGRIEISIPEENTGKYYTIEEIPKDKWEPVPPKTVKVTKGETTTVQFLNHPTSTKLIIQKFDDTNRNNRIDDGRDKGLQGWEFKVTDPVGNTKPYYTKAGGEIVIDVPAEYGGKEYTIEEKPQRGWESILPVKQPVKVTVPEGKTTTVQFLNSYVTKLIIQKFDDSNQNNEIDSNDDEKLQGWVFKVTDPDRNTKPYTTNIKGEILIEVPPEYGGKEYNIEEILRPGWKSILPVKQPVEVPVPEGKTTTVQFLNVYVTKLIIQKFSDTNQNNRIDSSDNSLKNWSFNITDPAGKTSTHITNDAGEIRIVVPEEYAGKEYIIEERLPPKWELVLPIEQPVHVKIPMGKTKTVQFLNKELITRLRIQKFDDINRNGEVDSEDKTLRGWNFRVTDPDGNTTTYITNDVGEIRLVVPEEYVNKDYTVEEELKDGWNAILPEKQTVKVQKGKITTVQFLNFCETELIIQKFDDTNRNKKIDNNDAIIRDWEFTVTDPTGNTKTYFTNIKGEIIIVVPKKYAEKEYTIEEKLKDGWKAITPTKQTKKVPEGKTTTVQFLNFCETSLTIHKFNDSNQNKVQDLEEQDLAWNFIITFPDGITKRITTDENGIYTLHDIPVGRYEITEEPGSCLWASSTETTQRVDVEAGKEKKAFFGNYIAECCRLPGRMWNNSDKNIEVCKSVDPYSVALGNEEEVTVYLGLCVDPKHIIKGTKVENISVIDTLHNQFTIVDGSFSEDPNASWSNPDGTTTLVWNISDLCCEEWRVSFNVTVAFALPIDVTEHTGVASMVMYDDPDIEETKAVKELPIPAGKLLFVLPTPAPSPSPTPTQTPKPPGFEALLAIAGLLAVAYMMWRRKR